MLFSKRAIRTLKWERSYEIKSAVADWGENEIAIEIHCDAGGILTKSGRRAQIGICGFRENRLQTKPKMLSFANVSMYPGLVIKVRERDRQLLFTRGIYKRRFTFRHGQDLEMPVSRAIAWEYRGSNTDVCEGR